MTRSDDCDGNTIGAVLSVLLQGRSGTLVPQRVHLGPARPALSVLRKSPVQNIDGSACNGATTLRSRTPTPRNECSERVWLGGHFIHCMLVLAQPPRQHALPTIQHSKTQEATRRQPPQSRMPEETTSDCCFRLRRAVLWCFTQTRRHLLLALQCAARIRLPRATHVCSVQRLHRGFLGRTAVPTMLLSSLINIAEGHCQTKFAVRPGLKVSVLHTHRGDCRQKFRTAITSKQ